MNTAANHAPQELSPETLAWIQSQIAIASTRAAAAGHATLPEEIDRVDDWANGIFALLADLVPLLLREQPEVAAALKPRWAKAARRYAALQGSGQRRTKDGEPLEQLEARKMLYRTMLTMKAWPD